ncbi:hypothetical protein LXL04_027406 [Taraxacum kok-saghyz]
MQLFGSSEISPSLLVLTASCNNTHMMYVLNRNDVCLIYREWNRPLRALYSKQDHKLMFGVLFSLKSLTAKMDPSRFGSTLCPDYLSLLLKHMTDPLKTLPKDEGVEKVVEFMDAYSINQEDFELQISFLSMLLLDVIPINVNGGDDLGFWIFVISHNNKMEGLKRTIESYSDLRAELLPRKEGPSKAAVFLGNGTEDMTRRTALSVASSWNYAVNNLKAISSGND